MTSTSVAVVVIGRNEGIRLQRCMTSLQGQGTRVVYVDSGSIDGSVSFARGTGALVVELDTSSPFTAARARNAGFHALREAGLPDYVQFVDGDCGVEPGWIAMAQTALDMQLDIGIVTGWRREIEPDRSVYNSLAELEWHRPAGDIVSCGGDMMVRSTVFTAVGGFDGSLIAGEDDDFCLRVRAAGLRVHRLPQTMTHHDADMTRFSQWWRRAVRTGHAFAQIGALHPQHFVRERQRVLFYGGAMPVLAVAGLLPGQWYLSVLAMAAWGFNWLRTRHGLIESGQFPTRATRHAAALTLSKLPAIQGMITYYARKLKGTDMQLIEYKEAA